jgi:D-lyxose ketol-isomerase
MSEASSIKRDSMRGTIVFHTAGGDIELGPVDKVALRPHSLHAATVGATGVCCIDAPR